MVPRSMVVYKGTILNFFHLAERINLLERSVKKLSREDKFLKAVRSSSRLILVIPRSEQVHCL